MKRPLAFAATIVALGGYSDDFASYSQLDRLRVPAVRSELPDPFPAEPATLCARFRARGRHVLSGSPILTSFGVRAEL